MSSAITAFREYGLTPADPLSTEQWDNFDSRKLRYAIMWSMFDNTAYSNIHTWSKGLRATYGLYSYIRNLHNPSYRIGVTYQAHLMGGGLDPQAGDGDRIASALPIASENVNLSPALSTLWRDSVWQVNKDVWTLNGTIMGDAPLEIVDDTDRGKVYLKPMHPGKIKSLDTDPQGNVTGYTLEYSRADPRKPVIDRIGMSSYEHPTVIYTERVTRQGESVLYETFLGNQPWGWDGNPSSWSVDYGFVPLVMVKHQDVGLDWGWSELHAGLPKFREVDDIASALDDQIRKAANAPWLFNFPRGLSQTIAIARTTPTLANREPGRGEIPSLYVDRESAKGQPLIADLDINAVSARIEALQTELKQDYPELDLERHTASGDASGRALRYAQQPVVAKVQMRRAGYDNALVRAQQMAVAIGGMRRYPGYESFSLDSYRAGDLEHSIGERPVFAVDPLDRIEEDTALWNLIKTQVDTGYPLELAMRDRGFSEEKIAAAVKAQAEKQVQDQARFDAQLNAKQNTPFGG